MNNSLFFGFFFFVCAFHRFPQSNVRLEQKFMVLNEIIRASATAPMTADF